MWPFGVADDKRKEYGRRSPPKQRGSTGDDPECVRLVPVLESVCMKTTQESSCVGYMSNRTQVTYLGDQIHLSKF